jgi:hypothetical protein
VKFLPNADTLSMIASSGGKRVMVLELSLSLFVCESVVLFVPTQQGIATLVRLWISKGYSRDSGHLQVIRGKSQSNIRR